MATSVPSTPTRPSSHVVMPSTPSGTVQITEATPNTVRFLFDVDMGTNPSASLKDFLTNAHFASPSPLSTPKQSNQPSSPLSASSPSPSSPYTLQLKTQQNAANNNPSLQPPINELQEQIASLTKEIEGLRSLVVHTHTRQNILEIVDQPLEDEEYANMVMEQIELLKEQMEDLNEELEEAYTEWIKRGKSLRRFGKGLLTDFTLHFHVFIGFLLGVLVLCFGHFFFNILDVVILGSDRYALL